MTRLTQSDIIRAQEARIDSLTLMVERLTEMHSQTLTALTEKGNPRTASETVKIARSGTGDHTTSIAVEVVPQEGETLDQARARAMLEYEAICARYPMANGLTHAAPLESEAPTLAEQLQATLNDEVGAKRRGKDKP